MDRILQFFPSALVFCLLLEDLDIGYFLASRFVDTVDHKAHADQIFQKMLIQIEGEKRVYHWKKNS